MPYPAKRNPELEERVLSRIALGETLTAVAKSEGFHPTAWRQWCREDEALALAYAQAKDDGCEVIADQTIEIADTTKAISEHVQVARLRIDTRMKLLGKWSQKYSDKQTVNVGNKDGEALKVEGTNADVATLAATLAASLRMTKREADEASDVL